MTPKVWPPYCPLLSAIIPDLPPWNGNHIGKLSEVPVVLQNL